MSRIKKVCTVEGCRNWATRQYGLCDKHWMRWQRHGHTNPTRPKDWGIREKHPLYGVWTWRRRKKENTLCKVWYNDFWQFVSDVGQRPGKEFTLRRINQNTLYGPDNFEWVEKRVPKGKSETGKAYARRYQREYRKSEHGQRALKNAALKKAFGITIDVYEAIFDYQGGVCAICGKAETAINNGSKEIQALAVDHCHKTGKIRGLLCSKCNTGLGNFNDSKILLQTAINYLSRCE